MTIIVNIAGTSGAGKTAVVRHLIANSTHAATMWATVGEQTEEREVGRVVHLGERSIFIAGRYDEDLDSGGCDTIHDISFWFDTFWEQAQTHDVVFEGLFVMNHTRGLGLARKSLDAGKPFHVISLTTPLEQCKVSINERRARRGQGAFDRSWRNVEGNVVRANNFAFKLKQIGATVYKLDRAAAAEKLVGLFNDCGKHPGHIG